MGNRNSGLKNFKIPFKVGEEMSNYFLGYICADGNISKGVGRSYVTSLYSKDLDIIEKFKSFIGDRCKVHHRKSGLYHAYVSSRQLRDYMISLNIVPKKSLILDPHIEIDRHFLRGYFDGDGSIRNNKGRRECKITTGSKIFKTRICKYLDSLGVYYKVRTWENAHYICIERVEETKKFLNHIYKDSSIYLDRKYKQYVALVRKD